MTYAAGLALAVITLVGVAGCGQPDQPPADQGTVSVPIQPTITPLETGSPSENTSAAGQGGVFDLGDLLTTTSCEQTGGVWSYTGTFHNQTADAVEATVAISLVASADLASLTVHEVDIAVPAGGTVPVEAKDFYSNRAVDPASVQCLTGVTEKGQ
jgi:hypothetical protein